MASVYLIILIASLGLAPCEDDHWAPRRLKARFGKPRHNNKRLKKYLKQQWLTEQRMDWERKHPKLMKKLEREAREKRIAAGLDSDDSELERREWLQKDISSDKKLVDPNAIKVWDKWNITEYQPRDQVPHTPQPDLIYQNLPNPVGHKSKFQPVVLDVPKKVKVKACAVPYVPALLFAQACPTVMGVCIALLVGFFMGRTVILTGLHRRNVKKNC
eukprot:gnl/MRDRNA2_/MRDRNA2_33601_c0_seq2.p1 gnl/MRDRNA2_/MRDRNA2_33601_c0~~gnl/MRDRNA2_/MRDRNA2_33601_c0_seq2.p1  ORF type:complete len:216 (-),score=33.99 gnl/MRDRNA2_/MRDRNA2_33601_c0_seq2:115-762(-)